MLQCSGRIALVGIVILLSPFLLNSLNLLAENGPASVQPGSFYLNIPAQYGEIIFRCNEKSPKQIFIIGMSHRDSFTRDNGSQTSKV